MGKNEDDLKKNEKKIIFSRFLLNLGANLSWGWLSSLRCFFGFFFRSILDIDPALADVMRNNKQYTILTFSKSGTRETAG